ncbi:MAG: 2-C-methyl-D-erythritol 4-phosphate cytidylyltransferase [Gemmataceae bacterium]
MARIAVILPAAGKSTRFRDKDKKVFATIDGRAVWLRAAEAFVSRQDVVQSLVVIAPEDDDDFRRRYGAHLGLLGIEIVPGGAERFESVGNALARIRDDVDLVAIHDAARPCVSSAHIDAVFATAAKTGAALLAVPVSDTVKRSDDRGKVEATVPRKNLWLAQTPQVFRRDWLADAHARRGQLGRDITDDAQLVEAAGHPVHLVTGSASNLKITTREDLALAEAILRARPAPKTPRPSHPFDDEVKW